MPDWVSFVSAFVKVFSSVVVARMVLFWTGMYCCLNVDVGWKVCETYLES